MANNDDLKKLQKAKEKRASTSDARQPWQEFLSRNQSIHASKSVQAAEIISTFAGSWTGLWGWGPNTHAIDTPTGYAHIGDSSVPPKKRLAVPFLGRPGMPEINFPPYDHGLNRGGNRGPSLLGHPISFSVVGPTAKSPFMDWQWSITDNSGSPGVGDTLTIDLRMDGTAGPATVLDIYNLAAVPDGGLYLYFSQIGSSGDGEVNTTGGRLPITVINAPGKPGPFAKWELFRVTGIAGDTITLDPGKRLVDYFQLPGAPSVVRAPVLLKPHVTRLVPIPDENGPGRESVFVVVPPETTANTDVYPPYNTGTGSWLDGGFHPEGIPGSSSSYGGEFQTPLPKQLKFSTGFAFGTGTLETEGVGAPSTVAGLWRINNINSDLTLYVGKILRVYDVSRRDALTQTEEETVSAELRRSLGYFEIIAAGNGGGGVGFFADLRRLPEIDPATGEVFFGPGPYALGTSTVNVQMTLHDTVSSLFTSTTLDLDDLESVRLTNLIDPTWVERTLKTDGSGGTVGGSSEARPDKAIFDTSSSGATSNANPGSLFDLGFRMVLFPGKDDGGGNVVPDYDNPITSRELSIDPSITDETQYLDIDYSSGLVTLSHPPPVSGTGGDVLRNGLVVGANNPLGRTALFAACIPFSRDALGSGVRITGGEMLSPDLGIAQVPQTDAFSQRVVFSVPAGQVVDVRPNNTLDLVEEDVDGLLPPTGLLQLSDGSNPFDNVLTKNAGYTGKTTYPRAGTSAIATIICGTPAPADTLTIGGVVLTGVAGVRTPGADDFDATQTDANLAIELAAALNDGANSFTGLVTVQVSDTDPTIIILTAVPIGADGNTISLSTTSAGLTLSGANLAGGVTTSVGTRLTGMYGFGLPFIFTVEGRATLRRQAEDAPETDTTYGEAARSNVVRFAYADIETNSDGSLTITPRGTAGPAEELRARHPLGSFTDIARMYLSETTQNWTISGPPFVGSEDYDIGLEITRGKVITNIRYDFPDTTGFRVQPWVNRAIRITPRAVTNLNQRQTSNLFDIRVDSGIVSSQLPLGYLSFIPSDTEGLCAVVEGGTVATQEKSFWRSGAGTLLAGTRLVVNVKNIGDRTRSNTGPFVMDSAPANPINWIAYTATGAETTADIVSAINTYYDPQNAKPAEEGTNGRLLLTDRQVEVLPARHFLQSGDMTPGVTFDHPGRYYLCVYSADPREEVRYRWLSIEVHPTTGASFSSNDANVIAAWLNGPLYDFGHVNSIVDEVDAAGFEGTPEFITASLNPDLAASNFDERPFLWIGPNDPRHPDASNTVCLLCGGYGTKNASLEIPPDFFNVMVEFIRTREEGNSEDVGSVLGGDFSTSGAPIRCGLFYGNDATNTTAPGVGPYAGETVRATANVDVGFPDYGVEPLGGVVGSFPIRSSAAVAENFNLEIELPRGRTNFYDGPQEGTMTPDTTSEYLDGLEPYSTEQFTTHAKDRAYPFLGRWTWPDQERTVIDLSDGSVAGLAHIWVSYGITPYDERGFSNNLTDEVPFTPGYPSFLVYAGVDLAGVPNVAPGALLKGDRAYAVNPPNLFGMGQTWEGTIWETGVQVHGFEGLTPKANNFGILVHRLGFSLSTDHVHPTGTAPGYFRPTIDRFSALGQGSVTDFALSILPNPSAVTMSSALKFLQSHAWGRTTYALSAPQDSSGLDGGSATTDLLGTPSMMAVSGGRINLMSSTGSNTPAGISFTTPVLGSVDTSAGVRFATTFIEHGIFTTSLSLGQAGFGAALEGAGDWDSHRYEERSEEPFGRLGGHQAGGVGGLRISGDAQVWITNLKPLQSSLTTAMVRQAYLTNTPANSIGTGPVVLMGDASVVSQSSRRSGHMPSGFGLGRIFANDLTMIHQEATISIGLTASEWRAFQVATGNQLFPAASGVLGMSATTLSDYSLLRDQMARNADIPMPAPYLQGCYLQLGSSNFDVVDPSNDANVGIWRIVGTPLVTRGASSKTLEPNLATDSFPHTPYYGITGNVNDPQNKRVAGFNIMGHAPVSAIVGYIQVRVERYAAVHVPTVRDFDETFSPEVITEPTDGHSWAIYADEEGTLPIYVGEVVDPGGSPTGAPSSLRGLTLNPQAIGEERGSFPMDLASVFHDVTEGFAEASDLVGRGRLLGIHETMDRKGRSYSLAYFHFDETGTPVANISTKAYARMTVYASQRDDRMDEYSSVFAGEFQRDATGRVVWVGHPRRLSPGVLVDGGLGLVQATAFRSTPRPETTDTLGSLVVWGHNASYPLGKSSIQKTNVGGLDMPSTFNRAEVYEALTVVGPRANVIFEDARAARGLTYVLRDSQGAQQSWLGPRLFAAGRNNFIGGVQIPSENYGQFSEDALFPYASAGIKFRSPGTVVYERPFRPLDAEGTNVILSSFMGRYAEGGIKGMEIPTFGEMLLLPKGPPTIHGTGEANFVVGGSGITSGDLPLYEFYNGISDNNQAGLYFPINPGPIFSNLPVGASLAAAVNTGAVHQSSPGSVSQAYRHSQSHRNSVAYPYDGLITDSFFDLLEQMRVLDGMVIEDMTNGTFYTAGSVGRWKTYTDGVNFTGVTNGVNQVGRGNRSSVNGSLCVGGGRHRNGFIVVQLVPAGGETVTIDGVVLTEGVDFTGASTPAVATSLAAAINANVPTAVAEATASTVNMIEKRIGHVSGATYNFATSSTAVFNLNFTGLGSTVFFSGASPEVIYDLGPHTDPLVDVRLNNSNGFGDRVDGGDVRRPLAGHKFRITANVEAVPVMGPRGVDGGLLPPRDLGNNTIPNADAIFYSLGATGYQFQGPGDVGRFLYICGTHFYVYTGWWVIIDVIPDYPIATGTTTTLTNVAVLRKWKRGPKDRTRDYDSLPLADRAPILHMSADTMYNDATVAPLLFGATPSDLVMELTDSTGATLFSVRITSAELVGASVVDCVSLAAFANGDVRLNGFNVGIPGGPVANWISWNALTNNLYPEGFNLEVTYNTGLLTQAQKDTVIGPKAQLRIQFLSDTRALGAGSYVRNHNVLDGDLSIGFYTYKGHNSQLDRCSGDRNNAALMGLASTEDPNAGPNYEAYSAARGLRWVFSSPLTEEHVGSFMHLSKPSLYRFGTQMNSQDDSGFGGIPVETLSWSSGWPRFGDSAEDIGYKTDIYRINRCPNTGDILLGGDCELFFPEIVSASAIVSDSGFGRPILYSPLSQMSNWPDTETGKLPASGALNLPIQYALQPIAREKIVTISPRSGLSGTLIGHSGKNPSGLGPDGLGPAMVGRDHVGGIGDTRESTAHNISQWWTLMNRHNVMRTRVAEDRVLPNWFAAEYPTLFNDQAEMFNANDPTPSTTTSATNASNYTWTPAGEYWYLNVPKAVRDSWQYNASCPPPTLMIDLTDSFTQAMQPGGGINSPYPGKAPKGARLTRLWVNFGVWGKDLTSGSQENSPGYQPGTNESDVLKEFYMCFNLILEIPGSQVRQLGGGSHPLGSGNSGLPFGDRAPTAAYNHPDNSGDDHYPGGTIVVPLYMNREAGDIMPNVMERWVSGGPSAVNNSDVFAGFDPDPDWTTGDYEFGFGTSGDSLHNELHQDITLSSNAHNPIVWGGIDTAIVANGGPFTSTGRSLAMASAFPRTSRLAGGVRSAFTSGLVPDGVVFKRTDPDSLSAATLTGIVVTHAGKYPNPEIGEAGSFRQVGANPTQHAGRHCGHAFTLALTPIGDFFDTPKNGGGTRIAVDPTVTPASGDKYLSRYGKTLHYTGFNVFDLVKEPNQRLFKVGNWLDSILDRYGINAPSGSMLPPGARVFLEITAGPGPAALPAYHTDAGDEDPSGSGCWVGGVKCAFEVETADGTAYTNNVHTLGDDGS